MSELVLEAENLSKTYGEGEVAVHAVSDVDFAVSRGEVVLIMGPSGSGKTTLLSMLGAMLRPTSGTVVAAGVDLGTVPDGRLARLRATTFGFVFQDFNLLGALTARENVEFALNLAGTSGREARTRAEGLLEQFGLATRRDFRPEKLSGGEKQRVALARALANRPPVILADEPTANVESRTGHEIARLLRTIALEEGRAVVIVSHDVRLRDAADRVMWLEDGRLRVMEGWRTDPVCQMSVDPATGHGLASGEYFCSASCRDEFVSRLAGRS